MATFVAVAETKGFRAAGERLGVSHSAVSQTLRRLEERLGVPLVRRTTRSVHLTEAGDRLYASVRPALDEVRAAVAAVGELGDQPRGTLRVHISSAAETIVGESLLAGFLTQHPNVQLDLVVSDAPVDIVAEGFDAGVQLGEVIDKDMIAVPVTGDLRLAVVAAPSYSRATWRAEASAGAHRPRLPQLAPDCGRPAVPLGVHRERSQTSRWPCRRACCRPTRRSTAASRSQGWGSRCHMRVMCAARSPTVNSCPS